MIRQKINYAQLSSLKYSWNFYEVFLLLLERQKEFLFITERVELIFAHELLINSLRKKPRYNLMICVAQRPTGIFSNWLIASCRRKKHVECPVDTRVLFPSPVRVPVLDYNIAAIRYDTNQTENNTYNCIQFISFLSLLSPTTWSPHPSPTALRLFNESRGVTFGRDLLRRICIWWGPRRSFIIF